MAARGDDLAVEPRRDRHETYGAADEEIETRTLFAVLGTTKRRGPWEPPERVRAFALLGTVELDFREADMLPDLTEVDALSLLGRVKIIVPEGLSVARPSNSRTQDPLVTAFARAFHWQELIDSGRYTTITELADALEVDRGYVSRMLRLTLLAPDIVEAIVHGQEPSGLSLEALTKKLPGRWDEQRERLGLAAR